MEINGDRPHRDSHHLTGDKPFILYVGARTVWKNFHGLIKAYGSSSFLKSSLNLVAFGGGKFSWRERKAGENDRHHRRARRLAGRPAGRTEDHARLHDRNQRPRKRGRTSGRTLRLPRSGWQPAHLERSLRRREGGERDHEFRPSPGTVWPSGAATLSLAACLPPFANGGSS